MVNFAVVFLNFEVKKSLTFHVKHLLLSGLELRLRNENSIFLFLNQNICYEYLKDPSQWDSSFEQPKNMLKLMGKKIFTFLSWVFLFI